MLTRGDDTNAFGQDEFLKIYFTVPEGQTVTKAVLVFCNGMRLEFLSPESPIGVNLTHEQTQILKDNNCVDIELYDENNLKMTIPCIAEFKTRGKV